MFSERKVLLVVNPISGGTDKDEIFEQAIEAAKNEEFDLRIYQTTGDRDADQICELVDHVKPERVIVAGGDGTISMVAQAIHGRGPVLGILPVGSANGLAVDFGLPTSIPDALKAALGENFVEIDAVSINGEISLHLSDVGLNALLVKNYEQGESRGKIGYAREMLKTLGEHHNFEVRITTPQEVIETDVMIVIIANARKYGTGVSINPVGNISDGFFELVIARKLDFIETAKVLTGNTDFNPEIMQIISVKKALIECLDRDMHFQIDGEYIGEIKSLEAEIVEKYIKIAVP
ncbi:Putative lipid kinase BmrU [Dyadobacter sp. CECT 9275]|uniref:Lipid kinase BmrU n=1 Tax=Dyadobacter helix TaxID=2822344 RepID=A0A916NLV4_9BACT|nr:diacylglycerol kinase family protein [Dyadobacter sp. CECT 9275]CAG5002999.1 Putative lipid kinase BmrU [Dyadobacter sp. CECT 9275]